MNLGLVGVKIHCGVKNTITEFALYKDVSTMVKGVAVESIVRIMGLATLPVRMADGYKNASPRNKKIITFVVGGLLIAGAIGGIKLGIDYFAANAEKVMDPNLTPDMTLAPDDSSLPSFESRSTIPKPTTTADGSLPSFDSAKLSLLTGFKGLKNSLNQFVINNYIP